MARKSRRGTNAIGIEKASFETALYLRVSNQERKGQESLSIENQKKMLLEYLKDKKEFHLVKIYQDDGESGTTFLRPAFIRMMEDIKAKKINCILVKDLSRLGRNYLETGEYLESVFPAMGVRFLAVLDQYDSGQGAMPIGSLVTSLKNIMNEGYVWDIAKKERSAKRSLMRKGAFMGATAPYGYQKEEGGRQQLAVNPKQANIVRRIFSMVEMGMSDREIAKALNEEGILCPAMAKAEMEQTHRQCEGVKGENGKEIGKLWNKQAILRITTNEVYTGTLVQGKRNSIYPKGKRIKTEKENWIYAYNTHTAIIPEEQFERVQQIRKEKRLQYGNRKTKMGN